MAAPPGGPPDSLPPRILVAHPESGAVVRNLQGDAVIQFDEVIDEMGGASGAAGGAGAVAGIGRQVILSPVAGDVQVSWHRKAIHVKPSEGWRPDRVYHLELLPGIVDLSHNVMKKGAMVVFSTGPTLPHAAISGTVLQWVEQRALARAVVRAARLPDTVAYVTLADSGGGFALTDVPAGRYRVVAIQDQSGNRQLDPREAFDSTTVTVDSSARALLWAFTHDTAGPRLRSADPVDSVAFRLTFAQPLDPYRALDTARVHLFALPDTTRVPLEGVWTGAQYDSIQARARAVADSLRRARDTTAHPATPPAGAQRAPAAGRAPGAPSRPDTAAARADTSRIPQLLRQRPVPSDRFVARAATRLAPGVKYLIRVRGATNLTGARADGQAVLEAPAPKPAAPPPPPPPPPRGGRDTTRARPGAKPP